MTTTALQYWTKIKLILSITTKQSLKVTEIAKAAYGVSLYQYPLTIMQIILSQKIYKHRTNPVSFWMFFIPTPKTFLHAIKDEKDQNFAWP